MRTTTVVLLGVLFGVAVTACNVNFPQDEDRPHTECTASETQMVFIPVADPRTGNTTLELHPREVCTETTTYVCINSVVEHNVIGKPYRACRKWGTKW